MKYAHEHLNKFSLANMRKYELRLACIWIQQRSMYRYSEKTYSTRVEKNRHKCLLDENAYACCSLHECF